MTVGTVACGASGITTENSWFRLFDLDVDHGLTGSFCAESVDYGVEFAVDNGVPQEIVVTTACLDDGLPYLKSFLSEQRSQFHPQVDANLEFFNVTASGCCNADTQSMSIELEAPVDCMLAGCGSLFLGSSNLGQSGATYIASESCSIDQPTDVATLGFPDMHLLMVVNGDNNDGQMFPQSITQNVDPNSLAVGTIACSAGLVTTENSYFRLFDLDTDHDLTGSFCVESLSYGIESAVDNGVPQSIVVTTACLDDGLPFMHAFLTEVGSESHPQVDAELEFFNVTASGCCDADTQSLSIELEAPLDCTVAGCTSLYVGSNNLGQSAPTYIESASCGVIEPTDLAAIGFPDMHIVMVVEGDGTDGNGGDGGDDGGDSGGGSPCDCCVAQGGPGCASSCLDCEETVCGADSFCCDVEWDDICAGQASSLCTCCPGQTPGSCGDHGDGGGDGGGDPTPCDCCVAQGAPGCASSCLDCEETVCGADSFCCDVEWDDICARTASALCTCCAGQTPGTCGGGGGDGGGGDGGGDDGPVPASNGIGFVLMVVLFIGAAAYFLRRRSGK